MVTNGDDHPTPQVEDLGSADVQESPEAERCSEPSRLSQTGVCGFSASFTCRTKTCGYIWATLWDAFLVPICCPQSSFLCTARIVSPQCTDELVISCASPPCTHKSPAGHPQYRLVLGEGCVKGGVFVKAFPLPPHLRVVSKGETLWSLL